MASLKERVTHRVDRVRSKHPGVDHAFRTVKHYGDVNGNAQAGAVTYFGFLSFFPILALAFVVVGVLAHVYPDLRNDLRTQVDALLPGVVGGGKGQIPLTTFENAAATLGILGVLGLLYSGLGWLSGMRSALEVMFRVPRREQPSLVKGKLLDLATLVAIGAVLLLSVGLSTFVVGFSSTLLGLVGIDPTALLPHLVLGLIALLLAVAATSLLMVSMFKLLVESHVPRKAMWEGAVFGAVGFEVLKAAANLLLASTRGQPAFQAFGVALILLVWISYFSRLVMYSAAYAYMAPEARAEREAATSEPSADPADQAAAAAEPDSAAEAPAGEADEEPRPDVTVPPQRPVAAVGVHRAETDERGERDRLITVGAVAGAAVAGVAVTRAARRRSR